MNFATLLNVHGIGALNPTFTLANAQSSGIVYQLDHSSHRA